MSVHNSRLCSTHSHRWNALLWHCNTNGKLRILVKAQPAPQAPGHCHQLGLAYGRETWVYPANTLSATVAFLLLLDTNLLPQVAITHYSQLLTQQHSTKLLLVFFFFFFFFFLSRSKLIFKVSTTTWGVPPGHILIINWLLDGNDSERLMTAKTDYLLTD